MTSREGYDAYCLYLAINNHFHSDSYDYFKYNGKVSAKLESFMKRKDKYHFAKLARKYNGELKDFLVANLSRQKYYVRDLLEMECEKNYIEFKKRKQKLTYLITEEMRYLFDKYKHIDFCIGIKDGQHSNILREYLGGRIAAETLVAADKIFGIFNDYDTMMNEKFIWPKERKRLDSLAPFLELEHKKLQTVLQGIWL
ncbi:uncharacterized protein METZ01_LOCUS287703 [marine metagenome]|uniref:Bacteriophage T4 Gp59 helicase assembly protein N-terminal domain-containing protein n=1 Tax=marine metagenome TaxID=408172 RepID=A0A382LDW7_9ZZZZ